MPIDQQHRMLGALGFSFPDLLSPQMAEIAVRLLLAMAFGMVLGLDREARDKPAGLRSHMLVSLAAASLTLMTFAIIDSSDNFSEAVRADPLRVIEAVVAGIAFLGAGAIIRGQNGVEGITTGASMWVAGAVGIATGMGYYALAALTTVLAFTVLYLIGKIEHFAKRRLQDKER